MATPGVQRGGKLIHPRLPEDLHAAVAAYAKANDRSLQNAVVFLLRRGLEAEPREATDDRCRVHFWTSGALGSPCQCGQTRRESETAW